MSNLSNLLNGNGTVTIAESTQYEYISETDMAATLAIALEDALCEEALEALSSADNNAVLEGVLPEDVAVIEASIVRLDKAAKKQRAYKLNILQCAKEDDSKDYKKLETLWKMEKFLFRKLEKKYSQRARSRLTQAAKKAPAKGVVAKVKKHLDGLTRSQKETKKALAGDTKIPTKIKNQFNSVSGKLANQMK